MLSEIFNQALETMLNNVIIDRMNNQYYQTLKHKVVQVTIEDVGIECALHFGENNIHVHSNHDTKVDVHLSGTPFAFMRLAVEDAGELLRAGDLNMKGSAPLLQATEALLLSQYVHWQECMAMVLGDTLTHYVEKAMGDACSIFFDVKNNMQANLTEYIQEEARLLPPREAVDDFCHDVDNLLMATERLKARVSRLQKAQQGELE